MPKTLETPEHPASLRIYPAPDLPLHQYLPGIGVAGAEVPWEEAQSLIERGLAVAEPPKENDQ